MKIEFEPITSMSFRKPGPFGVSHRGPVSVSESYVVKITALLGNLAYVGFEQNSSCANVEGTLQDPFLPVRNCITSICSLPLRGPYVEHIEQVFFGEDQLYPLSPLLERDKWNVISDLLKEFINGEVVLKRKAKALFQFKVEEPFARSGTSYGTMLEQNVKTTKHLYLKKRMFYDDVKFFFEALGGCKLQGSRAVTMGGDGGVSRINIDNSTPVLDDLKKLWDTKFNERPEEAVVLVISPIIITNCDNLRSLDPLAPFKSIAKEVTPIPLFRRYSLDLYPLGWDMSKGSSNVSGRGAPRPQYPAVLPGSAVVLKDLNVTPEDLYRNGLGAFKDLGFGTVIPLPF